MSVELKLTKTPYQREKYTAEQLQELARCTVDPIYFIEEYCWIQHPTKGRMKFILFDYQRELLDAYHNHRYSVALISRQMGKCVCINTIVKIRNKKTGEVLEITIGELYEMQKQKHEDRNQDL